MMAFSDFALANEGLAIFKAKYAEKRTDKNRGAQMYFVRLQASHLDEAVKIVGEIALSAEKYGRYPKTPIFRLQLTLLRTTATRFLWILPNSPLIWLRGMFGMVSNNFDGSRVSAGPIDV